MYFPYLRGRQYELLAIRELLEENKLSEKIVPIVEPVKLSSTFKSTINLFGEKRQPLYIVVNPVVGNYPESNEGHRIFADKFISKYDAVILNNDYKKAVNTLKESTNILVIINSFDNQNKIDELEGLGLKFEYALVPSRSFLKRIRFTNSTKYIQFSDEFEKQDRNVDYLKNQDEFFSDVHLLYKKDGFEGFGDFSIIGEEYSETGFAPRAVAIHIIYFDKYEGLNVRHFVSDDNDDITNPAGKFSQALNKLVDWANSSEEGQSPENQSGALEEFKQLYKDKRYPGLGYVKKLSLKHHLEIMQRFLDKGEQ